MRKLLGVTATALLVTACSANPTYVVVQIGSAAADTPAISSIELDLTLAGASTTETLAEKNGGPIQLPTSTVLSIGHGEGALSIVAKANDGGGNTLMTAMGAINVARGHTTTIALTFGGEPPDMSQTAQLTASATSFDFGNVVTGMMSNVQTFTITNTGASASAALTTSVDSSAPFTITADLCNGTTLAAGASCTVGIVFAPTAAGSAGATLTVASANSPSASVALSGTGIVPGALQPTPAMLTFAPTIQGMATAEQTVAIKNSGGQTSGTMTAMLGGSNAGEFMLSTDGCSGQTLAPNAMCMVGVKFVPLMSTAAGSKSASLTVSGSPGGSAVVQLGGTSLTPSMVTISPSPYTFPNPQDAGTTSTAQQFTVTNNGGAATGALTVALGGINAGDFTIVNGGDLCTGMALAGNGGSCTVQVAFAPTSYNTKSAALSITGSGFTVAPATLTGTGRDSLMLTASKLGNGSGTVTAPATGDTSGVGINCGTTCTDSYYRTTTNPTVTLTATPATGSNITSWSIASCGSSSTCAVTLSAAATVSVTFTLQTFTLSVTNQALSGGAGTISSTDTRVSCGATCGPIVYNYNTVVQLNTSASTGKLLGWSGDCKGVGTTCSLTMTQNHVATATFGASGTNYMFLTSAGLALPFAPTAAAALTNADAHCKALATAAGLGGTNWVALLSNSTTDASSRLPTGRGWVRTDGMPFANNPGLWDAATYGAIYYPPRLDENGMDHGITGNAQIATGTLPNGARFPNGGNYCSDYTVNGASANVWAGVWSSGSAGWVSGGGVPCTAVQYYCFQTDNATTVAPIPFNSMTARGAFVTQNTYTMTAGGSIATLDAHCQAEATSNALPNPTRYLALAAPTTAATPASRFTAGKPWYRIDGVLLAPTLAALTASQLAAPLNATGNLIYEEGNIGTWTGAFSPNSTGGSDCADWSDNTAGQRAYIGFCNNTQAWFSNGGTTDCTRTFYLYCLEN